MSFLLIYIVLFISIIIASLIWGQRYIKNHGSTVPPGFEKTEEINIDPSNGKRFRIYYNDKTGERFYCEEKN